LTAFQSKDPRRALQQEITTEWWQTASVHFDLFVSDLVWDEIREGDPTAAVERKAAIAGIPRLLINNNVLHLAVVYEIALGIPPKAKSDGLHLAFAVAYEMDYVVTWNCAHIMNLNVIRKLRAVNISEGWETPVILTPQAMLESLED
jgi:predicted nucleic acid-binding protein